MNNYLIAVLLSVGIFTQVAIAALLFAYLGAVAGVAGWAVAMILFLCGLVKLLTCE